MRHSKNPARKIGTGSLCLKMTEEREKYLLNNIFCIVRLQSHRNGISEKTRSKLVMKIKNLLLKRWYLRSTFHLAQERRFDAFASAYRHCQILKHPTAKCYGDARLLSNGWSYGASVIFVKKV
jgi:hypothetical protein